MNELGLSARGSSAQGVLPGATHTTRAAYQTILRGKPSAMFTSVTQNAQLPVAAWSMLSFAYNHEDQGTL